MALDGEATTHTPEGSILYNLAIQGGVGTEFIDGEGNPRRPQNVEPFLTDFFDTFPNSSHTYEVNSEHMQVVEEVVLPDFSFVSRTKTADGEVLRMTIRGSLADKAAPNLPRDSFIRVDGDGHLTFGVLGNPESSRPLNRKEAVTLLRRVRHLHEEVKARQ